MTGQRHGMGAKGGALKPAGESFLRSQVFVFGRDVT